MAFATHTDTPLPRVVRSGRKVNLSITASQLIEHLAKHSWVIMYKIPKTDVTFYCGMSVFLTIWSHLPFPLKDTIGKYFTHVMIKI